MIGTSRFLVSVRNAQEAQACLDCGVDILDVKEPRRGALGAADPATLEQIARVVNGQIPLSFAMGELINQLDLASWRSRVSESLISQFRYTKLGLAKALTVLDWRSRWTQFWRGLPSGTQPVAVAYLDYRECDAPSVPVVTELAARLPGCQTVLLDTFQKRGHLFDHCGREDLRSWVRNAQHLGLQVVVAGSVAPALLPDVLFAHPDAVGVRGALCHERREGELDPQRVGQFSRLLRAGA